MRRKDADKETGYIELLRMNRDYRNLMIGRFISQAGDWFNSVALFTLLLNLTGSGEAVAIILIIKMLPTFFFGPLAGVVADRFNRKAIMLIADILRGILGFGFLFIQTAEQVWMVYALTAVQIVLSTFFEVAESAAVPNVVRHEDLVTANAFSSATWSVTLAFGAAIGGFVTDAFGRNTAFVIDALSFFVSAIFIWLGRIPPLTKTIKAHDRKTRVSFANATGVTDFIEGVRYMRQNPRVLSVIWTKAGWGLGGGVLLLLTVFGKEVFPVGRDGSASIGILYACRGFGALLGPALARLITSNSPATMRRAITVSFFISAIFYLLFAQSPGLFLAGLCTIGAHAGGSIQWVFSTTLLQMSADNRFLGRVFAVEQSFMTLTLSLSIYLTEVALDRAAMSPRQVATLMGMAFLIPFVISLVVQRQIARAEALKLEESQA